MLHVALSLHLWPEIAVILLAGVDIARNGVARTRLLQLARLVVKSGDHVGSFQSSMAEHDL